MLKTAMILILSEKKEIKKEMEMVSGTRNRAKLETSAAI